MILAIMAKEAGEKRACFGRRRVVFILFEWREIESKCLLCLECLDCLFGAFRGLSHFDSLLPPLGEID